LGAANAARADEDGDRGSVGIHGGEPWSCHPTGWVQARLNSNSVVGTARRPVEVTTART
jgi:hypothetical protein